MKVTLPGIVAAGSAILASVLTNRQAEKRHKRETGLKERELQQKLLETITPFRLNACREIFTILEESKKSLTLSKSNLSRVIEDLLWLDRPYSERLIFSLLEVSSGKLGEEDAKERLSQLQEEIRRLSGAEALNRLYTGFIRDKLGPKVELGCTAGATTGTRSTTASQ